MYRKEQAPAEAGDDGAVVALRREPCLQQHSLLDPKLGHGLEEGVSHRGEAQAEHRRGFQRNVSALQILACSGGVGQLEKLAREPVVPHGHRTVQWLVRVGSRPLATFRNDDANAARRLAYGGGIIQAQPLHEPGEDVSRFVAHEAVVPTLLRNDGEIPIGATVKWTRPTIVRAGPLEGHRFTDEPDEVGAVAHLLDGLIRDHAHAENSTMVTPVPP